MAHDTAPGSFEDGDTNFNSHKGGYILSQLKGYELPESIPLHGVYFSYFLYELLNVSCIHSFMSPIFTIQRIQTSICMQPLRKATKILGQTTRYHDQDSNRIPAE
jgi:hypothetical protein